MLFIPKKTKFKKKQKGKNFNKITKAYTLKNLSFGNIGLKVLESGIIQPIHLKLIKQAVNKLVKRVGRITINKVADKPITRKPAEVRMGKGKGNVSFWALRLKPGVVLCEIETSDIKLAVRSFQLLQIKLPMKTKIIFIQ